MSQLVSLCVRVRAAFVLISSARIDKLRSPHSAHTSIGLPKNDGKRAYARYFSWVQTKTNKCGAICCIGQFWHRLVQTVHGIMFGQCIGRWTTAFDIHHSVLRCGQCNDNTITNTSNDLLGGSPTAAQCTVVDASHFNYKWWVILVCQSWWKDWAARRSLIMYSNNNNYPLNGKRLEIKLITSICRCTANAGKSSATLIQEDKLFIRRSKTACLHNKVETNSDFRVNLFCANTISLHRIAIRMGSTHSRNHWVCSFRCATMQNRECTSQSWNNVMW